MTNHSTSPGPPFPIGGPTTTSWREHALTRVGEQRLLVEWLRTLRPEIHPLTVKAIEKHLDAAKDAAAGSTRPWHARLRSALGGANVERAMSNLDAAEAATLQVAPVDYVRAQVPNLLAHVRGHLAADDPRRLAVERIAAREPAEPFTPVDRDTVVAAVRIASLESRHEITRVRSFRNVLFVTAAALTLAAAGLAFLGAQRPDLVPVCFTPDLEVVCPTAVDRVPVAAAAPGEDAADPAQAEVDRAVRDTAGSWDIPLVELVGLIAGAVAAAFTLRRIPGTTTPYSLPIALAVLKLPTGALTALLGLLLMRGEFVPGLSALDSPAQIISWAILLGYAQQLFTGMVDDRAQAVLDDVGGGGDRPAAGSGAAAANPGGGGGGGRPRLT